MTLGCRQIPRPKPFSRLGRMPRPVPILLALGLGTAAALSLVACGGEDAKLLPGETAREIIANLDTVQQLSAEGDCVGGESAADQVGEQIEALRDVDPKLKRALEEGAARLEEVIAECEETASEAIAPATIPPETEEDEAEGREDDGKEKKPKGEEEPKDTPTPPPLPPQAKGEGKGLENGKGPPPSEEAPEEEGGEAPSGGVSPGAPAGEGE
jgi:hypothetical protein